MKYLYTILREKGFYNRDNLAVLTRDTCRNCKLETICLTIDGSDGEYDAAPLCKSCLNAAFNQVRDL